MVLKIEWPTGYMHVSVSEFFGKSDKRKVKKVFRLARQYNSDTDRLALIDELSNEIEARTKALDICGELEYKREQALKPFFGLLEKRPLPPQERELVKQRDRLEWSKEIATKERWG